MKNEKQLNIPIENLEPVFQNITLELRKRTNDLFELPTNERFEMSFVNNKPWVGNNAYQGDAFSIIQVNTDVPISTLAAIDFLAHETYPGHHTESSIKEAELIFRQGREELFILLALSPMCVPSEGIAMHARDILLPEDEIVEWLEAMILPMAKLDHLDAKNQLAIENAWREIRSVGDNAVFMYWVEGETEERVMEFCLEYSLGSTEFVENWVKNWITHPMFHLYTFNYSCGYGLLDRLFSRTGDRRHWFNTLLKETYLPGEIERMGTR